MMYRDDEQTLKRELEAEARRDRAMAEARRRAPAHCRACENLDYHVEDWRCTTPLGVCGDIESTPWCELLNDDCPADERRCPLFMHIMRPARLAHA